MNQTFRYSIFLLLVIIAVNAGINIIFNIIGQSFGLTALWRLIIVVLASILSALVVTLIVIMTAPVLRDYLLTFRQLLRLDTLSHPLLLKLQEAAPSTFAHSLQVANLAHLAAKAIKADAFLTRIGGYYHDIGKIKDAEFFIENRKEEDTQSVLDPAQTAKKIHNHIKEGVKLAQEYKLPKEIINFIPEHHGTIIAGNLYEKAKEKGSSVSKSEFRYPGPKPMSKETALIMLADAIESKTRSLPHPSEKEITKVVNSVIDSRIEDNQLILSGLSKGDLEKVRKAFTEGVLTTHHRRITYHKNEN